MKKNLNKPLVFGQYLRMMTSFSRGTRYTDLSDDEKFEYNLIFGGIYMTAVAIVVIILFLSGFWDFIQNQY